MCVKKKKVFIYGHIWWPKWPSTIVWQNMNESIVCKIIRNLPLFKTRVYEKKIVELEFHKKWHGKFKSYLKKKKTQVTWQT